jgi:hypothetical protein
MQTSFTAQMSRHAHSTRNTQFNHTFVKQDTHFFGGDRCWYIICCVIHQPTRIATKRHRLNQGQPEIKKSMGECDKSSGFETSRLGDDLDDSTGLLDLLLGQLGDESGLDDERLADSALAEL